MDSFITVIIRQSGNHPDVNIQVEPSTTTVLAFKELLETQHGIQARAQRLIHSGEILNDESYLESYNIREGSVIHVIRTAQNNSQQPPAEPTSTSSASLGISGQNSEAQLLRALSNNPAMRRLAENPELMRAMLLSNPQVRDVVEKNPEYGHMLSDPSFFRQGFEMARNPDKMREVLRNNDRAISNLEMLPGGFNHLKKIYQSLQEPMENAQRGNDSSSEAANRRFAEMYDVQIPQDNQVNDLPLPNPWNPPTRHSGTSRTRTQSSYPDLSSFSLPMASGFSNDIQTRLQNMQAKPHDQRSGYSRPGGSNFVDEMQERLRRLGFQNSISTSSPDPEQSTTALASDTPAGTSLSEEELLAQYASQIERLNEMGFDNLSDNIRALQESGGDVDDAVEWLLQLKG